MDVSIIITTYNYATYVKECIESCLEQVNSKLEYEVIVVDDGSTDETESILVDLIDSKLRKYRIENVGIERASNFGFEKASGNYILRVDADDKLLPNYLLVLQPYLQSNLDYYYPDYFVINSNGEIVEETNLPEYHETEILQRGDFLATGTLYSSEILERFNGYVTTVKNCGLENYELILRLIKHDVTGKHIPQKLFCYRRHASNISVLKKGKITQYGQELFSQMGLGIYTTNKFHPYNLKIE